MITRERRDVRRSGIGAVLVGGILIVIGGYYLLTNTLGVALGPINWDAIWPLAVVGLGIAVIVGAFRRSTDEEPPRS